MSQDPILDSIVKELVEKHRCHTVVLYGSRARGLATPTSDYDVFGVRKTGPKFRIAKKDRGLFWDVFVYSEKDLKKLSEEHFNLKNAKILFHKGTYSSSLLKRIETLLKKPYQRQPESEIEVLRVWAEKQLERCQAEDIQGLFRRSEFLAALIGHYFEVRQMRFLGPKEGFAWLEMNDPKVFRSIRRALENPAHLAYLKSAAAQVYI